MPDTSEPAGVFRRFLRTAPMSWLCARILHRLDNIVHRITAGRTTFTGLVTGLPVVMLTTTGAKSGQPRTVPLLGLRDEGHVIVIASSYGRSRHPGWYHNLRATPHATVHIDGKTTPALAHEAKGGERDRLWQAALRIYPGYAAYERRAAPRRIPILVLTPTDTPPRRQPG
ncbi:MAG: nitroreductase family deazaflavin-dependent oxidoreductase [Pseudonocardiaceae bacterium]